MSEKLRVEIVRYDDLPQKVPFLNYDKQFKERNKEELPNNGNGREYADYLLVYYEGILKYCFSDAMQPEDCCFLRDLNWIKRLALDMFWLGILEAKK